MAAAAPVTEILCPRCVSRLEPGGDGRVSCYCGWSGEVYLFRSLPRRVDRPEEALPDDATCVHHPTKRAVVVCEGTGDYICSLCAVEIDGKTYSAQFLSRGGKEMLAHAFDRYLDRPDRRLTLCLLLSVLFFIIAPLAVPIGIYYFAKLLKLRRENDMARRAIGDGQVVLAGVFLALFSIGALGLGIFFLSRL
jgi:hypothetical protein